MSNVKLAIRVRPFTERELKSEKDRVPVVNVEDEHVVTITNIKVSLSGAGDSRERVRRYYADYTFDSACAVTNPAYASQDKVFATIGTEVLGAVSRGSSACVLTYGQSATGKTHTMMGTDTQPGLVPRLCKALIETRPTDITISFLEIYNERVHDLLAGEPPPPACNSLPRRRGNSQKDLRVREHPTKGPYVQNLRRVAVHDTQALLSLVEEGARRRRTAATRRNSTSSRSHALLELSTAEATLHLADLAGSEKASWEGCGGGRQKEGANINKSLVALSNVISALVSGGGFRGHYVPYRDSALTWLLKDCFTGAACTFLIATVSPSAACYGESAATLRWAARARQLPKTRLTTTPLSYHQSRAALQAQLNQLLAELNRQHIRYIPETGRLSYDENHWKLLDNKFLVVSDKTVNIGNIMNNSSNDNKDKILASSSASVSSDIEFQKSLVVEEIVKEVDVALYPALERTRSGSDLKVIAPIRHRRRQYRSQEVLPVGKILHEDSTPLDDNEIQITKHINSPSVSMLHDKQRAEIVASVTERLYSKLKKKEKAGISKIESVVDKKVMEPLSELKICTNARKRLMELSKKALRNKRKIGIPAHTQTRTRSTRVRDQGIDVQKDLDCYVVNKSNSYTLYHDVATETIPVTPRYKEIGVGPNFGSLFTLSRSTMTEVKRVSRKNTFMMTDNQPLFDQCTQTHIAPPPRRKKYTSTSIKNPGNMNDKSQHSMSVPFISINISQNYSIESESQTSDDDFKEVTENKFDTTHITPDLLTNRNNLDSYLENNFIEAAHDVNNTQKMFQKQSEIYLEDFSDVDEEFLLPRKTVDGTKKVNRDDMEEIILGRNKNVYPYNIILSPPRKKENIKKLVKFKDVDTFSSEILNYESDFSSELSNLEKAPTGSDSVSSKDETNSFIWKSGDCDEYSKTISYFKKKYTPVYNNSSKYKTVKDRTYKKSLGLERERLKDIRKEEKKGKRSKLIQHEHAQNQKLFENKDKLQCNSSENIFKLLEKKILDNCDKLEMSVDKYDSYFLSQKRSEQEKHCLDDRALRTPTAYMQHLVKLRREVIKAESDSTINSSKLIL